MDTELSPLKRPTVLPSDGATPATADEVEPNPEPTQAGEEVLPDEIGPAELQPRPDVDLSLTPSRDRPIAGELWSVAGEIHNRSSTTAWIVNTTTVLTIAPEMWGQTSDKGSMRAFFPTTRSHVDEIVRIDPGAKYVVIWKVNTLEERSDANKVRQVVRRVMSALKDFTFFNPGRFGLFATVHVWSVPPILGPGGYVTNVGQSFPVSVTREVDMEASQWVLIFGAMIGGVVCFILQGLFHVVELSGAWGFWVGLSTATLLCGVVTVLIARLAKTDFLLIVKVDDIWGAITAGFVVQWFGYKFLLNLIPALAQTAK